MCITVAKNVKLMSSLCKSIRTLTDEEKFQTDQMCHYESHLSPAQKNKLVKLVGEKCNINCTINNVNSEVLWDTGSQVSMIGKEWIRKHAPLSTIMDLSELMGRKLDVISAGGDKIPYEGVVLLDFHLDGYSKLSVPFIVPKENISTPIIGYNVIRHVLVQMTMITITFKTYFD